MGLAVSPLPIDVNGGGMPGTLEKCPAVHRLFLVDRTELPFRETQKGSWWVEVEKICECFDTEILIFG